MFLYTINHIYPDKTFAFTITANDVGCAAEQHTHAIGDITNLRETLNGLANEGHTHDYVDTITPYGNSASGEKRLILTAPSGIVHGLSVTGNDININFESVPCNHVDSLTNHNDVSQEYKIIYVT
jgi:hypothetical protein